MAENEKLPQSSANVGFFRVSRNLLLLDDEDSTSISADEASCEQHRCTATKWNIAALIDLFKRSADNRSVLLQSGCGSDCKKQIADAQSNACLADDDACAMVSGWPFANDQDPAYFIPNTSSSELNNNASKWDLAALRDYAKTGVGCAASTMGKRVPLPIKVRISQLEARLAIVAANQRAPCFSDFAPRYAVSFGDFPSDSDRFLSSIDVRLAARASAAVPMKFRRSSKIRCNATTKKPPATNSAVCGDHLQNAAGLKTMNHVEPTKADVVPSRTEVRNRNSTPSSWDDDDYDDVSIVPRKTDVVNTLNLTQADLVLIPDPKRRLQVMLAKYNALRTGRPAAALSFEVHARPTATISHGASATSRLAISHDAPVTGRLPISHGACAASRVRDKYLHKKTKLSKTASPVQPVRVVQQAPRCTVISNFTHKRIMQRAAERGKELRAKREERERKEKLEKNRMRKEKATADYAASVRKRTADKNARRDFMRQQVEARGHRFDEVVVQGLQRATPLIEPLSPTEADESMWLTERAHTATYYHRDWSEPPQIELFLPVSLYNAQENEAEEEMAMKLFKNLTVKAFKVARQAGLVKDESDRRMFPERPNGVKEGRFRNRVRCKAFNALSRNYVDGCKVSDDRRLDEWKRSAVSKVYDEEIGEAQCMEGTDAVCLLKNVMSVMLHIPNSPFGDISQSKNDMLRGIEQDPWNNITRKTGMGRFMAVTLPLRGQQHHLHELVSGKVRRERIPSPPGDERWDGEPTPPPFDHDVSPPDD